MVFHISVIITKILNMLSGVLRSEFNNPPQQCGFLFYLAIRSRKVRHKDFSLPTRPPASISSLHVLIGIFNAEESLGAVGGDHHLVAALALAIRIWLVSG